MVLSAEVFENPGAEQICALLKSIKTIAVVGFSPLVSRPSHAIASRMQTLGFRIIPVRPGLKEGLGEKAYADIGSIPEPIDLVNVFRNGRHVAAIVDQCLEREVRNLWMQEGCFNPEQAARARAAGMTVVMERCILRDYTRLCR